MTKRRVSTFNTAIGFGVRWQVQRLVFNVQRSTPTNIKFLLYYLLLSWVSSTFKASSTSIISQRCNLSVGNSPQAQLSRSKPTSVALSLRLRPFYTSFVVILIALIYKITECIHSFQCFTCPSQALPKTSTNNLDFPSRTQVHLPHSTARSEAFRSSLLRMGWTVILGRNLLIAYFCMLALCNGDYSSPYTVYRLWLIISLRTRSDPSESAHTYFTFRYIVAGQCGVVKCS